MLCPARCLTAAMIVRREGRGEKLFRRHLRRAGFAWHSAGARWSAEIGSPEDAQLEGVMRDLQARRGLALARPVAQGFAQRPGGRARDADDILDLCDAVLGQASVREARFDVLRGDDGRRRGRALPVDAYYPALSLVIEYHERQHSEAVGFFDKKDTVSGMPRGQQRSRYDGRRAEILPQHGLTLLVLDVRAFDHDRAMRLRRVATDEGGIRRRLVGILPVA